MKDIIQIISTDLNTKYQYVQNVINLIDEGNTIPFIARYRKEAHGAMDDTSLRLLEDKLTSLRNLEKRREEIIKLIDGQGYLTEELSNSIETADSLSELEDIYRPYKPKRKTRASIAKEKGLEPLAIEIFAQKRNTPALETLAKSYINPEKDVNSIDDALAGASDIIAEMISDSADNRHIIKELIRKAGFIAAKNSKEEDSVYSMYYEFNQPVSKMQGHQILALNRGEKEGFLKVNLELDEEKACSSLYKKNLKAEKTTEEFVKTAINDGYSRLMFPSLENETRSQLTEAACEGAIKNFAINLKPLLMQPPVKGKVTMGLDPGYRMGCKVAVVDATGKVLDTTVVYPTHGDKKEADAILILSNLIKKHKVERIAIGNGTASRETEITTVKLLKDFPSVSYMIVNEAGASVYSVSKLASEEFPDYDVNLRSAISIARRLQDPLAELVKIDPKSIGVGQYQHDMPKTRLDESLTAVVEDCVNSVGADLNTASASLLQRIAGLSSATAKNIVVYREENGIFTNRKQLLKVPKLGPKAFEQCAGFLRIAESKNILDNTGVHPESYTAAEKLLELCGYSEKDVKNGNIKELPLKVKQLGESAVAAKCEIGVMTLKDIIKELILPGRDPRDELPPPIFRTDLLDIKDLTPGMLLTGTVRNVIDFGAFVDIGVHQDGLVHISEICDQYIKHPSDVLSIGQDVQVVVISVDEKKKRIALSMKINKYVK